MSAGPAVVQDDHRLVTTELHGQVRNPSCAGAPIIVLGQGPTFGNWLALLVCVGGMRGALAGRMRVEARALRGRFGEAWDAFVERTWALIPGVW